MVRETSREAYASIIPELNSRQRAVFELLEASQSPLTDKEIAERVAAPINTITPRRGELVEKGIVREAGKRRCSITGRRAITWTLADYQPPQPKQTRMEYVNIGGVMHAKLVEV